MSILGFDKILKKKVLRSDPNRFKSETTTRKLITLVALIFLLCGAEVWYYWYFFMRNDHVVEPIKIHWPEIMDNAVKDGEWKCLDSTFHLVPCDD